ncbi:uncharacterized protein DS421_4g131540 [Arachis hypogaea]|nr:uncharacterized protein DS421_4g131540 [Arachis hypogaea]
MRCPMIRVGGSSWIHQPCLRRPKIFAILIEDDLGLDETPFDEEVLADGFDNGFGHKEPFMLGMWCNQAWHVEVNLSSSLLVTPTTAASPFRRTTSLPPCLFLLSFYPNHCRLSSSFSSTASLPPRPPPLLPFFHPDHRYHLIPSSIFSSLTFFCLFTVVSLPPPQSLFTVVASVSLLVDDSDLSLVFHHLFRSPKQFKTMHHICGGQSLRAT